jgi:hypothetical protein
LANQGSKRLNQASASRQHFFEIHHFLFVYNIDGPVQGSFFLLVSRCPIYGLGGAQLLKFGLGCEIAAQSFAGASTQIKGQFVAGVDLHGVAFPIQYDVCVFAATHN